ncbi:Hypothetical predicted protein [Pelobates cultripes]|uniref:Uncharacterized protein n=1 Tax=Pelobates cultripes TaxID=61616 RepID=A0AAD1QYL8_PELCU|nr:Hypothetical predicted protein [Pelobates cultripes]
MGRSNRAPQTRKTPDTKKGQLTSSLSQFLETPADFATQPQGTDGSMASENSAPSSPAIDLQTGGTERPPWLDLLRALPAKEDLRSATSELGATIRQDIQALRADMQGLSDRVSHVEAASDSLRAAQTILAEAADTCSEQVRGMALHIEDLDNRGHRNNIRLRGLPEDSPLQLWESLLEIFNGLLGRNLQVPIDFVRAHRALRPKGSPDSPPRETILKQAREQHTLTYRNQDLQLFPDLSPATLTYRRALKPLTRVLVTQQFLYRWQMPTGLLVHTPRSSFLVHTHSDYIALGTELQLPAINMRWPDPLDIYNAARNPYPRPALPQRTRWGCQEATRPSGTAR